MQRSPQGKNPVRSNGEDGCNLRGMAAAGRLHWAFGWGAGRFFRRRGAGRSKVVNVGWNGTNQSLLDMFGLVLFLVSQTLELLA